MKPLKSSPSIFQGKQIIVLCYVDELLVFAEREQQVDKLKNVLTPHYYFEDLGRPTQFPNIELEYKAPRGPGLPQTILIDKLLPNQGMEQANPVDSRMSPAYNFIERGGELTVVEPTNYRSIVESIPYPATKTRADLCVCNIALRSLVERPGQNDKVAENRVLRYLRGARMNKA